RHLHETYLVLNGDILTDLDLTALVAHHRDRDAVATIALGRVEDARPYGLVAVDEAGRVLEFQEKPADLVPGAVNAGTYVLEPGGGGGGGSRGPRRGCRPGRGGQGPRRSDLRRSAPQGRGGPGRLRRPTGTAAHPPAVERATISTASHEANPNPSRSHPSAAIESTAVPRAGVTAILVTASMGNRATAHPEPATNSRATSDG